MALTTSEIEVASVIKSGTDGIIWRHTTPSVLLGMREVGCTCSYDVTAAIDCGNSLVFSLHI